MRNSPINHIRQNREYANSPYEPHPRNSSPRTGQNSPSRNLAFTTNNEGEYWRQRAMQLETELIGLNEELLFQVRKNEKIDDLQQKIELLLAQNTHFVDENQNLIRLVQQKNSEIEVWRKKFDSEFAHSSVAEAEKKRVFDHLNIKDQEHQIQIQKLLSEITRLQGEAVEQDNQRKIEVHRLKNQYESEAINQIQNLKRSQHGNNEIQELNIRKLKDMIDEKNFEIENLNRQIKLKNEELKAEVSFNKNQLKKSEEQKLHEIDLIKTEHQNVKNNLIRAHRKNQDDMKNLNQAKVKRLTYEIEEKKNQIEESNNRLRRTGKENESEFNRLINDNSSIRNETKENDNRTRQRLRELTEFFENQFNQEREVNLKRQANLRQFYQAEIASLNEVIAAKEAEIRRILEINKELKENQEFRLAAITSNNQELKNKIDEVIKHYEREIQLMKIKVSELYEADIEALRSNLRNTNETHTREADNLRQLLAETQEKLANEVQDRLDLRKQYQHRLIEFKVKYEREHHQLNNLVAHREKELEGHTSKVSLTHIEHNQVLQTRNVNLKQMMQEKRILESHLQNKNKEIQALNLRIQSMIGLHERDISKLEEELQGLKNEHSNWLKRQDKENKEWHDERNDLKARNQNLSQRFQESKRKNKEREEELMKKIEAKNIEIANFKGHIQEYESKVGVLHSKNKVEVENVERTFLETKSLMNNEKDKLLDTVSKEKRLLATEHDRNRSQLQKQLDDLKQENEILQDNYRKAQIREAQLRDELRNTLDSVNKRNKLEEHVINIGLSNNYFKNVAQIFKRPIDA